MCRQWRMTMTTTCGMRGGAPAYPPRGPAWMMLCRMCCVSPSGKRRASPPRARKVIGTAPACLCPALLCPALPHSVQFWLSCPALPGSALPCISPAIPCLILLCLVLPCPVLSCPALSCLVLTCHALPCSALPCPALPCPAQHSTAGCREVYTMPTLH